MQQAGLHSCLLSLKVADGHTALALILDQTCCPLPHLQSQMCACQLAKVAVKHVVQQVLVNLAYRLAEAHHETALLVRRMLANLYSGHVYIYNTNDQVGACGPCHSRQQLRPSST